MSGLGASLSRSDIGSAGLGSWMMRQAGHQVLVLNLAQSGRIMIAGDLYHYPQERTLRRPPPDTEFNVQQAAASRLMTEDYLNRSPPG